MNWKLFYMINEIVHGICSILHIKGANSSFIHAPFHTSVENSSKAPPLPISMRTFTQEFIHTIKHRPVDEFK